MFSAVLARVTVHLARRLFMALPEAAEAVPRIASALDDVRATLRHLERLLAYVAEELPEIVDQVEQIRARVDGGSESPERPRHSSVATKRLTASIGKRWM